jgi:hypothetical protein
MIQKLFVSSGFFLLTTFLLTRSLPPAGARQDAVAARMRERTLAFIEALGPAEKSKAVFAYDDRERLNWHFIPRERKGLPLKELKEEVRKKALDVLRAGMSETGVRRAEEVMGLEEVLRKIEGAGGSIVRDPLLYYVSIFGTPDAAKPWSFRLEGHHLSLNLTLEGDKVAASTPIFYGANPARVPEGPKEGLRVLGPVEDTARKLVGSLDKEQLAVCLGKEDSVPKEVGTDAPLYKGPFPAGLEASKLGKDGKETLRQLIREYTGNLNDETREKMEKRVGEDLAGVHFAWRGALKAMEPHSYLVHGPGFVISYVNMQNNGAHVHCALRDLEGDFGGAK